MSEPISVPAPERLRPPSALMRPLELRAVLEASALLPAAPWLARLPRGDSRPVMLLPGFLSDDRATWPLRRFLRYLGYAALPWGLGRNRGQPEEDAERLVARLPKGPPITLVGWSLGGVVARLVAQSAPERVKEVITLGTPIEGGPKYTAAWRYYRDELGVDLDQIEAHIHERNAEGIKVPLTVIYTKGDGVVSWRAAIDRHNPHARHIPLTAASHIGLGFNPQVWSLIARTLHLSRKVQHHV